MNFIFLTILIMHYCTFVIIGPTEDIESQVAATLEPFDKSLEVKRYKDYLDKTDIKLMAKFYGVKEDDIPALVERMPECRGTEGGIDEIGLIFLDDRESRRKVGLVRNWWAVGRIFPRQECHQDQNAFDGSQYERTAPS